MYLNNSMVTDSLGFQFNMAAVPQQRPLVVI